MRIIAKRTLRQFWEGERRFADAKRALEDWYVQANQADWSTPADVKAHYGDASILKGNRVVFNICGNKYRLIVAIHYDRGRIYVRYVLTHSEYDKDKWKEESPQEHAPKKDKPGHGKSPPKR